jgi:hypothetical protein
MDAMPDRPDYKSHPLWTEAMALAHLAYGVAEDLKPRDPDGARQLRRAAVAVPARVAGALNAGEGPERETEASGARAALSEVAARASAVPASPEAAALAERAGGLSRSVALALSPTRGLPC